ncbi:SSI family serine proteinase inhibitor [Streptomyces sp. VRA16 Mangrove soil]|uniref:SSI family serine proteinase inhibitor n=1 Tax=Streptomyces sp. VRA16 Mangrove soil TaxID=2817434 RepID=UPI001A9F61F1|nr:SSI family serine proteinase inhibitor [Streptomyces sp. VRA16 Mangrove soil]MBO1336676.1 hypothetical protein [Streptomyces sp. VRA16 Mangrove soil]
MLLRRLSHRVLVTSAVSVAALAALPTASHADTGPRQLPPRPFSALDGAGPDRLTVTVTDSGNGNDGTHDLRCGPAGGSHPDPGAACAQLDRVENGGIDPFAPVPAGTNCTMQYGGDATARITGTWHGRPVDASYKLTDGCEIARWHRIEPVLPATAP